ncbi:MAG TPA: hypothetical protein VGE98_11600 [Thermoanaerobaculia bacterium]
MALPTLSTPLRRLACLALVLALAAFAARAQEPSFVDWVRHSGFIFLGTVKSLGTATPAPNGARDVNGAVVTVDRVLEALPPIGNPAGKDVNVRLRDPQKFQAGQRAVFFTYLQSAGTTLGLVEVASQSADQPEAIGRRIADARRTIADEALAARLASAELVVVGTVGKARPTPEALDPSSEHDPRWYRAPIRVESFEKGKAATQAVTVNIAYGDDVVWRTAPKPKEGDSGIFLLQPERQKRYRAPGLFLIDPLDWQPRGELERVRRLLKATTPR